MRVATGNTLSGEVVAPDAPPQRCDQTGTAGESGVPVSQRGPVWGPGRGDDDNDDSDNDDDKTEQWEGAIV